MKRPLFFLLLLTITTLVGLPALAGDPVYLFDGTNLDDWTARAKGEITTTNKMISIETTANLWLTHKGEYTNFVLEVEAKIPETKGANGGIAFRCKNPTGKPKGYQCEVDAAKPGGIYGIGTGGWLSPKKEDAAAFGKKAAPLFKKGDWNAFKIRCEGKRFQTWMNGEALSDIEVDGHKSGYFAIQHHGKGPAYQYRNIKLTVLE